MEFLVRVLNRPESMWTAMAVGLLSVLAVVGSLTLASCESTSRARRSPTSEARGTAAAGRTATSTPTAPVAASTGNAGVANPSASASVGVGTGASAGSGMAAGEPEIRVRILAGADRLQLGATGGVMVAPGVVGNKAVLAASGPSDRVNAASVSITLENGHWMVTPVGEGKSWVWSASSPLVIVPANEAAAISTNGQLYPGRIRLSTRTDLSSKSFDVVEFVGLEEYLPGVVGKELPPGWPLEAYKVQAVCARTYAMHERERSVRAGQSFDVESSERDQMYTGVTTNATAVTAVRATKGQAIMWEGKVLRAYYSSTCGGRTASAKDTWPTGPGYEYNLAAPLQAKRREFACQGTPLYRWSVTRDRRELAARMRAFGERNGAMIRQVKEIGAIEVAGYNEDGRPSRFKVVEPGGKWYGLSGEEFRLACNSSARGVGSAAVPVVSGAPILGTQIAGVAPGATDIDRSTRVNSSDVEASVRGGSVVFSGRGFGHGVGMCQFCAKGFAERGEDWKTIVTRFYPGARVETVY